MIRLAAGLSLLAWLAPSPARSAQAQPGWGQVLKASLPKALAAIPASVAAKLGRLQLSDLDSTGPYTPIIRELEAQGLTAEALLSPDMDQARRDRLLQEALTTHVERANQRASAILAAYAREEILAPEILDRHARDAETLLRDSALFLDFSVEDRLERVAPILRRQAQAAQSGRIEERLGETAQRLSRSPSGPGPMEAPAALGSPGQEPREGRAASRARSGLSRRQLAMLDGLLSRLSQEFIDQASRAQPLDEFSASKVENWHAIREIVSLGAQPAGPSREFMAETLGRLGLKSELAWLGNALPEDHPLIPLLDQAWNLLRRARIQEPDPVRLLMQHVQGFPPPESLEPPEWEEGPEPFSEALRLMAGMKPYVLGYFIRDSRLSTPELIDLLARWGKAWEVLRLVCRPGGLAPALATRSLASQNLAAIIKEYRESYSDPALYRLSRKEIAQRLREADALIRQIPLAENAR